MKLKELFQYYKPQQVIGPAEVEITGFSTNSKEIEKGNVFFALKGQKSHGIRYAPEATRRGAVAVIGGREIDSFEQTRVFRRVNFVRVDDPDLALSSWSAAFYGFPTRKMDITGVTGTNGKTTVSSLIYRILKNKGKAGFIGTPGYSYADVSGKFSMTTPRAHELQRTFANMLKKGVKSAVMEVSSHALKLKRVDNIEFSSAVFTNLSRDHLDFHKDFKNYFDCKLRLFKLLKTKKALVNIDDRYGSRIPGLLTFSPATYGFKQRAHYRAKPEKTALSGSSFIFFDRRGAKKKVEVKLVGKFNISNCLAAMAWGIEKGGNMKTVCKVVSEATPVPGRLEIVSKAGAQGRRVVIDYAHTPAALENVLGTLRPLTEGRLICVFGCGGDRDRDKRPLMGEIAGRFADVVYVTNDNPRNEEPFSIILDIELGVRRTVTDYFVIPKREECIEKAIKSSRPGDCVLIAGKGDEEYQIVGDKRIPFSDRRVARKYL